VVLSLNLKTEPLGSVTGTPLEMAVGVMEGVGGVWVKRWW
jgi:hypothetical protein